MNDKKKVYYVQQFYFRFVKDQPFAFDKHIYGAKYLNFKVLFFFSVCEYIKRITERNEVS